MSSLVGALRSQFENWLTLGVAGWVALPSRCPPRSGWARLARLPVEVRLRNGIHARCRVAEVFPFVEVWVYGQYDVPGMRWDTVRTVVDVGANAGAATLWFASRAPSARIVALEPAPAVVDSLRSNVKANGFEGRVEVLPVALGPTPGVGFVMPSASSTSASVDVVSRDGGMEVRIVSLSQLLDEVGIDDLDVLKLDCEGAEFEIVRSGDKTGLERSRVIVGEYHTRNPNEVGELLAHLEGAGFRASATAAKPLRRLGGSTGSDHEWIGLFQAVRA